MTRKVLKYNNFKPITKFLKKFNLRSFVNKKKIQSYMNFFELDYLLKEIPDDRKEIGKKRLRVPSKMLQTIKDKVYRQV